MRSSLPRRVPPLVFGLAVLSALGCGPSVGSVAGKVTYNGAPLKGGNVILIPDGGGMTFSTSIQEDGTYSLGQVRTGKYKVCVETESLKQAAAKGPMYGGKPAGVKANIKNEPPKGAQLPEGYKMGTPGFTGQGSSAARYVAIPAQYGKPETTPLTIEVKGGSQATQFDIPLS